MMTLEGFMRDNGITFDPVPDGHEELYLVQTDYGKDQRLRHERRKRKHEADGWRVVKEWVNPKGLDTGKDSLGYIAQIIRPVEASDVHLV